MDGKSNVNPQLPGRLHMTTTGSRKRDVTVADVAREAKVSKAQAARALGGYGAVSEEVSEKVLAAAEALGYRPNELARSMNTGKSNTIGVVVGDIENPYFGLAMRGMSDAAKRAGYDVILINTGEDHQAEVEAVRVLQDKRVDGLIVAPASSSRTEHLQRVVEAGRPLVLFDRSAPGVDVDVIAANVEQAAYDAAALLLNLGHERIAYVSALETGSSGYGRGDELESSAVADRIHGTRRAFDEASVPFRDDFVRLGASSPERVQAIVSDLLNSSERTTAIVASDSLVALSVLETLRAMDVQIPRDLSFVMYDDFPWTRLVSPPLTVVSQPVYELGQAAAVTLLHRIRGAVPPALPAFPATLITRDSVAEPSLAVPAE